MLHPVELPVGAFLSKEALKASLPQPAQDSKPDEGEGLNLDIPGAAPSERLETVAEKAEPEPGQPKAGDEALILGARYKKEPYYFAMVVSKTRYRETDDLGQYFNGYGLEIFAEYDLNKSMKLRSAFNYLKPEKEHPGDYRECFATFAFNYRRQN
ncbi:hypothetical protein ACFLU6_11485 [Acidobacteriota bacterium]